MDLGFRLGPRLNASGRLDTAQASLDLLLAEDPVQAQRLAAALDKQNRERQQLEHRIQMEAHRAVADLLGRSDPAGIVIGASDWHPGVIGIVASRLVKKFHRPVFVVAFDDQGLGKGSGRSIEGISLVSAIQQCRDLLINGGGHDMAAGLTIRQECLAEFQERFADSIARQAVDGQLEPRLFLDAETRLEDLDLGFLRSYDELQPFGNGNPQPLFVARNVMPASEPRILKEKHIKFEFYQDGVVRTGVWFNGVREGEQLPSAPWDVAFFIDRNTFRGTTSVQLLVQGLRRAAPLQQRMVAPLPSLAMVQG
jgi:single-stranded-DNA-specific exonuclease